MVAQAAAGQTAFEPPRLADGRPNLQGIWQAASRAAFNVEEHGPSRLGGPGGASAIVDPADGKLPYLPAARARAMENGEHRERDPVGWCHMHGVPRAMAPPFPMMIVQDGAYVVMLFETEHGVRIIPTDGRPHLKDYWSWQGDSRGRWEGDTLVIESRGFNGKTWLDQAGNFVDENLRVVERLTMTAADTITYEATVEDATVFSRPWTLRYPLRRQAKEVELLEYACIEGERDAVHYPGR
jgi:hypothetical protein